MTAVRSPISADALQDGLSQLAQELPRWNVPGLQVAVVHTGQVLYAGGLGVLGVDNPAPVGPDTLFHHGSCCKAYTSLLACLLAEQGLVDLDEPVRRYVPELRLPDEEQAGRITIRDLLSHRSGISRHDLTWILNPSWDRTELVARLEHLPLAAGIGEKMEYSNLGYALAGLALERATGTSWDDLLQQNLLAPLGMTRATTDSDAMRADPDAAVAHLLRDGATVPTKDRKLVGISPAGGLMTSATDAARWLQLQLGAPGSLSAAAVAQTHQLSIGGLPAGGVPHLELDGYGLGWLLARYRDRPLIWHSGGIDGFSTYTFLLPEQHIGITICANLNGSVLVMAAALQLLDGLLGVEDQSWYDLLHPMALAMSAAAEAPPAGSPPSLSPEQLAGSYTDAGYGELVLEADGKGLRARLGETDLSARHIDGDTWQLRYDVLDAPYDITFEAEGDGQATAGVALLDPSSQTTRFARTEHAAHTVESAIG